MKKLLLFIVLLCSISLSFSQEKELSKEEKEKRERNIQAGNPFKEFGYKPKIATLSKGKYLEFHDLDSIVKIGSFTFHVKRKIINGYSQEETKYSEATLRPEIVSRWFSPDPLSDEFPSWSPYNFVKNNPLRFIDPTGLAPEDIIIWYKDENNKSQSFTYTGNNESNAPKNKFVQSVLDAACNNTTNGSGKNLQSLAENKNVKVSVAETSENSMFSSAQNAIFWNPEGGTETDNGTVRSPASVLEHEADHAVGYNSDSKSYFDRLNSPDSQYSNKEERRVITGSEQTTARANGEISGKQVTRRNHNGRLVITNGVSSNAINRKKTYNYYKLLDANGYQVNKELKKYKPKN